MQDNIPMSILKRIKEWWYERKLCPSCKLKHHHWLNRPLIGKEMNDFISQSKEEQKKSRKDRPVKVLYDIYPMQEGMLPKDYVN